MSKNVLGIKTVDPSKESVVPAPTKDEPDASWSEVTAADIGSGFEAVDDIFAPRQTKKLKVKKFRNKFVKGRSRFISYDFKVTVTLAPVKTTVPINAATTVSKADKLRFSKLLSTEISSLRDFFVYELIPVSLSLQSAAEEVKDVTAQLVDDPVGVPLDYLKTKSLQAIQLRITRHLVERFKLTEQEARLMLPEFIQVLGAEAREKV